MGIFRRGTKNISADPSPVIAEPERLDSKDADGALATPTDARDVSDVMGSDGAVNGAATTPSTSPTPPRVGRSNGPFDRSEVDSLDGRLDLGALWLTGLPGMELRVEVEEDSEILVGVTAVLGESAVQLQAFAAPRTEGIWEDIRAEIAESITSQGGTADKTFGPLGAELQVRMPGQGPDSGAEFSPVRFLGVDGPRWFLRAVLSGPAALDEEAASPLLDVVRATVVVRGDEAMAPREMLPLKLPEMEQVGPDGDGQDEPGSDLADPADPADPDRPGPGKAPSAPSLDDLKPFERGPEITEIH